MVRRPELSEGHVYLTLDDVLMRDEARRDPDLFLDRGDRLVIDEVQRAPDLLLAIKRSVDERRAPADVTADRILEPPHSARRLREPGGAGRVRHPHSVHPAGTTGIGSAGLWSGLLTGEPSTGPGCLRPTRPPKRGLAESGRTRGGYPIPPTSSHGRDQRAEWFAGYSATYLERDLRQLSVIENLADMRRLMAALCQRLGGLMNQAEISRGSGNSHLYDRPAIPQLAGGVSPTRENPRLFGQPHPPPHQGAEDLLERHRSGHAPQRGIRSHEERTSRTSW